MNCLAKHLSCWIVVLQMLSGYAFAVDDEKKLDHIRLPAGFKIQIYARDLPNARSLTVGPGGVLFVGTRKAGKVYAVMDVDQNGVADDSFVFAEGLNMPNGVAFKDGSLYVAEVSRILRYDNAEKRLKAKIDPSRTRFLESQ